MPEPRLTRLPDKWLEISENTMHQGFEFPDIPQIFPVPFGL
jgi:hypothetical protein